MDQKTVQLRMVDVFAYEPFSGNSAGVVLDADELGEGQMQRIAREVNASETAFIRGANDLHRPTQLRWFSPTTEVRFCGHATLAAAHALNELRASKSAGADAPLTFETEAGMLNVYQRSEGDAGKASWWLQMPDPSLKPAKANPVKMCELLGLSMDDVEPAIPPMSTRDDDVIVLIKSWRKLVELEPDFQKLGLWSRKIGVRGFCVSTLDTLNPATHVHSRFFAPGAGVNEDPVTGSVHGPLATLLMVNELIAAGSERALLTCVQGEPGGRTGMVQVLVQTVEGGFETAISGACFTTLVGEMRVPPGKQQI